MQVKTEYLRPGQVDEAKYAAFVTKTEKSYLRQAAKGHRDYKDWTPAQCREAAESLCSFYRHQFRTLVPASPSDPR